MSYYKIVKDGYIPQIGIDCGGEEITEAEHNEIAAAIDERPTPPDGYDYRLKTDLTWELVEMPEPEDVDADEALEILLGGAE